jgi:hypothetical protein
MSDEVKITDKTNDEGILFADLNNGCPFRLARGNPKGIKLFIKLSDYIEEDTVKYSAVAMPGCIPYSISDDEIVKKCSINIYITK